MFAKKFYNNFIAKATGIIFSNGWANCIISYLYIVSIFLFDYLLVNYHESYYMFLIPFYMFPIFIRVAADGSNAINAILISIVASFAWYFGDILKGHSNLNHYNNIWTAFGAFIIFITFSYVIYRFRVYRMYLKEFNEKLKLLNELKNRNLGIASHDIKNPLGVINFSVELLLNGSSTEALTAEQITLINLVKNNATKIQALVHDQLNWSKIESGEMELKLERTDYIIFVKNIAEGFNRQRKKNISVDVNTQEESLLFSFDKFKIEEVLNNLLGNAIKFSFHDSEIKVNIVKDKDAVLTEVIDCGVGMTDEDLNKIFIPFVRGSSQPTGGESSTGLGLAIVQRIISAHGGQIKVSSKLNSGSKFYFTLPVNGGTTGIMAKLRSKKVSLSTSRINDP